MSLFAEKVGFLRDGFTKNVAVLLNFVQTLRPKLAKPNQAYGPKHTKPNPPNIPNQNSPIQTKKTGKKQSTPGSLVPLAMYFYC